MHILFSSLCSSSPQPGVTLSYFSSPWQHTSTELCNDLLHQASILWVRDSVGELAQLRDVVHAPQTVKGVVETMIKILRVGANLMTLDNYFVEIIPALT